VATKNVRLDGDTITSAPIFNFVAVLRHPAGHLATGDSRELQRNGKAGFLEPEIDVVEAAALNLDNDFVRARSRISDIAKLKFARRAMSSQLDGLHGRSLKSKV